MSSPKGYCNHDNGFDSHCPNFESKLEFIGRPERETVIGHDDELNLKIALETSKDLEEFLSLV